jgi:hypothetical protein
MPQLLNDEQYNLSRHAAATSRRCRRNIEASWSHTAFLSSMTPQECGSGKDNATIKKVGIDAVRATWKPITAQ